MYIVSWHYEKSPAPQNKCEYSPFLDIWGSVGMTSVNGTFKNEQGGPCIHVKENTLECNTGTHVDRTQELGFSYYSRHLEDQHIR